MLSKLFRRSEKQQAGNGRDAFSSDLAAKPQRAVQFGIRQGQQPLIATIFLDGVANPHTLQRVKLIGADFLKRHCGRVGQSE